MTGSLALKPDHAGSRVDGDRAGGRFAVHVCSESQRISEARTVRGRSPRDRRRVATTREIKRVVRRILREHGPQAVSLRAIGREMGMTAPALYRYYGSREELLQHVVADSIAGLAEDINTAIRAASTTGEATLTDKLLAACREFRRWSLCHRAEFGMLFGTPSPGAKVERDGIIAGCGQRFAIAFLGLFLELWSNQPSSEPAAEEIDPGLREQLERHRWTMADPPAGVVLTLLSCWARLCGIVAMEVFGHLGFALDDAEPMFELILADMLRDGASRMRVGKFS